MTTDAPPSDTSRIPSAEPERNWPEKVEIRMHWKRADGSHDTTSHVITSDEFFGRGPHGAPMSGDAIVSQIERLRRAGVPPIPKGQGRLGQPRPGR